MIIDKHLSPEAIAGYRAKSLNTEELLAAVAPLGACPQCRGLTARGREVSRLVEALGPTHLSFEELEMLAKGPASTGEPEVLQHIAFCRMCAAELANLRSFRTGLEVEARERKPSRARLLIPAGAFAVALVVFFAMRVAGPVAEKQVAAPVAVASIFDGVGTITLSAKGQVGGVDALGAADREAVIAALRTGQLPTPVGLGNVTRSREVLLSGEKSGRAVMQVEGPVGAVVGSQLPLFRWTAPAGAAGFRVAVFDTDFNEVAKSPVIAGTEWQATKPLPRGRVYIWTVTGTVNGASVTVPRAPEPEARFSVLNAGDAEALQALASRSKLAFALAAWKLGMKDEARAELAILREANVGSAELARVAQSMAPPK